MKYISKCITIVTILCVACLFLLAMPVTAQSTIYLPAVVIDTPCSQVTEIPQSECEVLLEIYNQTDGPNWLFNESWLSNNHPCGWHGIQCEDGHIVLLSFITGYDRAGCHGNRLNGPLPPAIGSLSQLRSISSCDNIFTTPIPAAWGNLANLESIEFIGNQLSGPIPPELGNLSQLQSLNLNSNQLSGSIPPELGNLQSLNGLSLLGNQLTGQVPEELANLPQLKSLELGSNTPELCVPAILDTFAQNLEYYGPPDGGVCP